MKDPGPFHWSTLPSSEGRFALCLTHLRAAGWLLSSMHHILTRQLPMKEEVLSCLEHMPSPKIITRKGMGLPQKAKAD